MLQPRVEIVPFFEERGKDRCLCELIIGFGAGLCYFVRYFGSAPIGGIRARTVRLEGDFEVICCNLQPDPGSKWRRSPRLR
jgi:hypothetical protein